MAERVKRRRLNPGSRSATENGTEETVRYFTNPPLAALTEAEKSKWNGFCEIESEPALFNVMLREFGVKGVKVQEVVSLDDEMLQYIHKPIYGLIFLFRWKEDDPRKQEQSCPEGLWFANQTSNNACASVALLNIINNIPDIDLGEHLRQFKEFTMSFTPALRGDAIANFEFVKRVHNSFARKMDVLNIDLQLKNEASERKVQGASSKNTAYDESEAGFHFIAFVPVNGKVWKFDGLERQPQSLGTYDGDDWLKVARPDILARMAAYEEDQIEFSILSLVREPLLDLVPRLASNVKSILAIDERLSAMGIAEAEIKAATDGDDGTLYGPDGSFDLTQETLDGASVPEDESSRYEAATREELLGYRRELVEAQRGLRASIKEEQQSYRADEDYAASRRHDYGPAIHQWIKTLARKGLLQTLVQEIGGA
ncbi:hypothetical protein VTO42DRAFT_4337 [Malbranchea cinnamomea]